MFGAGVLHADKRAIGWYYISVERNRIVGAGLEVLNAPHRASTGFVRVNGLKWVRLNREKIQIQAKIQVWIHALWHHTSLAPRLHGLNLHDVGAKSCRSRRSAIN
jgi:hypothetical protein